MLPLPAPSDPTAPAVPPLWREGRIGLEWAGLRRSDVFRGDGVPQGDGRGVLLIPGFLAGDGSLGTMTQWLRAAGWHTKRAGIRANIACSEVACTRIEERLEALAERTGDRVAIVGQSRGGVFAKALARAPARARVRRHRARLPGDVPARGAPRRARPGRRRRGARQRADARPDLLALPARRVLRALPRGARRARSRATSATCRSTRARTGSSTGARAWIRTRRASRSARRTAG